MPQADVAKYFPDLADKPIRDAAWCEAECAAGRRIVQQRIHLDRPLRGAGFYFDRCFITRSQDRLWDDA